MTIISPGFFTTIQDSGRYGYRSFGMPVSGAMDFFSHMAANLIVGNKPWQGALEVTLTGPVIEFSSRALIAITGAEMNPMINNHPVEMWSGLAVGKKDRLSFGSLDSGARVYISFAGGLDVPVVMGSSSTYLRGSIGGINGKRITEGDRIKINTPLLSYRKRNKLPVALIPEWTREVHLGILEGIDFSEFPDDTIETFLSSSFKVTNYSDRMGIRLSGPVLKHMASADVISYPIAPGTIQVPGDGNPVIMLADSQTVGGYTQIANIISADLWRTGQLKPWDEVRFKRCDNSEALKNLDVMIREIYSTFGIRKATSVTDYQLKSH